jgi:hypothetical protein
LNFYKLTSSSPLLILAFGGGSDLLWFAFLYECWCSNEVPGLAALMIGVGIDTRCFCCGGGGLGEDLKDEVDMEDWID